MTEINQEKIRYGLEAENLTKNTLLKGIITSIRNEQYNAIESSTHTQSTERTEAYYLLRAIRLLESRIESIIRHGKIESGKIKQANITKIIQR